MGTELEQKTTLSYTVKKAVRPLDRHWINQSLTTDEASIGAEQFIPSPDSVLRILEIGIEFFHSSRTSF